MAYKPKNFEFNKALPVWEEGKEKEPNTNLIFRAVFNKGEDTLLRIAGQMHYVVRINGKLLFEGPARCAAGWNRADEFRLDSWLDENENILSVAVEGLYATGFSAVRQPSFLCAEIEQDGKIIAATGVSGFEAIRYNERIKKTQRYSYQRPFSEAYHFDGTAEKFMRDIKFKADRVSLKVTENKRFITRNVPFPLYTAAELEKIQTMGCGYDEKAPIKFKDRSLTEVNEFWTAVKKDELDICASDIADRLVFGQDGSNYSLYDAKQEYTGIIEADIAVSEDARIVILFDEVLEDGAINFARLQCCNSIVCDFKKGKYNFSTLQLYSARYIGIAVIRGKATAENIRIRRVEYPDNLVRTKKFSDGNIQKIFNAGRETFKQNAVDILMDCPSRERAGWLYDSTFISRAEYAFTGKSIVTKNYLENFIIAEEYPLIPENMIPGCYPADNDGGNPANGYILNCALWFVIQLKDYFDFSHDNELIDGAKDKVYGVLKFFKQFFNDDGLIARTRGWVFIEHSGANRFQQDISYPLNMLFCCAQKKAGELYNDSSLVSKSEEMKKKITEKSFDGHFFVDNAVYRDGVPVNTENHSEHCQYGAFFFGIADREHFSELWDELMKTTEDTKGLVPTAMWSGKTLRIQLLAANGMFEKAKESVEAYCLHMALRTGTLWEFDNSSASCCHGFESSNAAWMLCDKVNF